MLSIILISDKKYELSRALDSIKSQTYQDYEIIVVTSSLKGEFKADLSDYSGRISWVNIEDMTRHTDLELRSIGLAYATGDYISFLDSYDIWYPDRLEQMMTALTQNGSEADIVTSNYKQQVCTSLREIRTDSIDYISPASVGFLQYLFAPSSVIIRHSLAVAIGQINISGLHVAFCPQVLSEHYSNALSNYSLMERNFLTAYENQLADKNIYLDAVIFLKECFEDGWKQPVNYSAEIARCNSVINTKHQNYLLMRDWVEKKIAGRGIADYLTAKGITSVGIYGAGRHGTIICDDLLAASYKVDFMIDRNKAGSEYRGIQIIDIPDLDDYDGTLIISLFQQFDAVAGDLKGHFLGRLLSIRDIVEEM